MLSVHFVANLDLLRVHQSWTDAGEVPAERHGNSLPSLKKDDRIGYLELRFLGQGKQKLLDRAPATGGLVILYLHGYYKL